MGNLHSEIAEQYKKALTFSLIHNDLSHLFLYGPPGSGKNSFVLLLLAEFASKYNVSIKDFTTFLNAGKSRGIDMIRTTIKNLALTKSKSTLPHFIIFDEADKLTVDAQRALRRSMELYIRTFRIILICNSSNYIIDAIQSRTNIIYFPPLHPSTVKKNLLYIHSQEKMYIKEKTLDVIVIVPMETCVKL